MKKILTLYLLLLTISSAKTECDDTFFKSGNRLYFTKVAEIDYLEREELEEYVVNYLKIKDATYLKAKSCSGSYMEELDYPEFQEIPPHDKVQILFEYTNSYSIEFYIKLHSDNAEYWDFIKVVVDNEFVETPYVRFTGSKKLHDELYEIEKNKLIDKERIYILDENNKPIGYELLFSLKEKVFFTKKIKVIVVDKVDGKTYVYGAKLQLYPKNHRSERFVKLNQEGKVLDVNASSWACTYDKETLLTWKYELNKMTWLEKDSFIDSTNKANLCGFSDWRLPNTGEIHSTSNTISKYKTQRGALSSNFFYYTGRVWSKTESNDKNKVYAYYTRRSSPRLKSVPTRTKGKMGAFLVRGKETIPAIYPKTKDFNQN